MKILITREQALQNEVYASVIGIWQKRFDPREHPYMTKPGNYFDREIDKERFYDQPEIDKINKQELQEFLKRKDNVRIKEYQHFGELKYNLNFSDVFIYSIELGKLLEEFANYLETDLIFILDYDIPWLSQKNNYEPVSKALNYLAEIGTTERFTGAYKLSGDELAEFAANLFWVIRCNASLPYCWFSTETHQFVGSICKYGNLHFDTYSEVIKDRLLSFATKHSLVRLEECTEAFSTEDEIEGRQIIVDK